MTTRFFACLVGLWLATAALAQDPPAPYQDRDEVYDYIDQIADEHGFDVEWLEDVLLEATHQAFIIRAMDRPAESVWTWSRYRRNFLDEPRIVNGVRFWRTHEAALKRAASTYGVPIPVILAVLGVETRYGAVKGRTPVRDALMTLGFDYPRRAKFFRKQLTHFLLMVREENLIPGDIVGSYAGAMGYGQFIPSSYRAYAVDFDGDGVRDLVNNPVDAIGSIAAYLSKHGWREGAPVAVAARMNLPLPESIAVNKRKPHTPVADYYPLAVPAQSTNGDLLATLLSYDLDDGGHEYWLGFHNFYVITRYNTSRMYALAVHQLSLAIADAAQAQTDP